MSDKPLSYNDEIADYLAKFDSSTKWARDAVSAAKANPDSIQGGDKIREAIQHLQYANSNLVNLLKIVDRHKAH